MELVVAASAAEVGRVAAERIAELCRPLPAPVLGVATGSSPLATYAALAAMVRRGELHLDRATVFALDEYVGLAAGDERSYAATIARTVTVLLGLRPSQVHVPDPTGDLDEACTAYEAAIAAAGGVDVQLLGIGANGHLGFNEPGAGPTARTHVGELSARTRSDNARFFDDPAQVPERCLTQGLGTIMAARHLVLVADGEHKARAVAAALEGPVGPDCPASLLQRHPSALVVVDPAAARLLRGSGNRVV